eukprot:CAMPEP_0198299722 /NCGR_PEP_ID=MMETSP1449-20131203/45618_1 /TAXON_ID=420275 /ORGANISM="Attheya septentrionalis, Strain CCMP2084" /LENGTH=313 /DNA_ID=CAMNT_0044001351 /DNA_START=224 /DNA_END=1165 /DNA_ORIENTATION=+
MMGRNNNPSRVRNVENQVLGNNKRIINDANKSSRTMEKGGDSNKEDMGANGTEPPRKKNHRARGSRGGGARRARRLQRAAEASTARGEPLEVLQENIEPRDAKKDNYEAQGAFTRPISYEKDASTCDAVPLLRSCSSDSGSSTGSDVSYGVCSTSNPVQNLLDRSQPSNTMASSRYTTANGNMDPANNPTILPFANHGRYGTVPLQSLDQLQNNRPASRMSIDYCSNTCYPTTNSYIHSGNQHPNPSRLSSTSAIAPPQLNNSFKSIKRKIVTQIDYDNHQQTERIQKQRMMLSDGGSLFHTSPRSFLMGGRR